MRTFKLLFSCLALAGTVSVHGQTAMPPPSQIGGAAPPIALRMGPAVSLAQIRALPPSALVLTSSGRQVKASQMQTVTEALQGMGSMKSRGALVDLKLSRTTAKADVVFGGANTLAKVRTLAPNTVVQLSNGTKLTVADIAKLEDFANRTNLRSRLGVAAPAAGQNAFAGRQAVKVKSMEDVLNLKLPDSTVIEAPNGSRSTLGEVRPIVQARVQELKLRVIK